jgi:hypothetical protein
MDRELVETHAVKAINKHLLDNPSVRVSARQRHVLKNYIISVINNVRYEYKSIDQIPDKALQIDYYIRSIKSRPIDRL